ncbi:hypothetical protein [Nocardiopsis sp. NRRL B-16309]|uniref:hypothetical protein n=1 Tax=Nocardiopsis sp. NRRL B-16309 TaxID=1519494 RepID=UPI0006ADA515|nr:hypothetical protein [Nocardiopsis sp. NRRL B-16309]KOX10162.1 hypothetical protein ADL05_26165 [Nocardiopsis sp. NRRL B-16309]
MDARRTRLTIFFAVLLIAGVATTALWAYIITTRGPQLIDNLPVIAGAVGFMAAMHIIKWRWPATARAIDTVLVVCLVVAAAYLVASGGLNTTTVIVCGFAVLAVAVEVRGWFKRRTGARPAEGHETPAPHDTKEN